MDQYQHTDKCRWWDDEEFCDCGAIEIDRLTAELTSAKEEIGRQKEKWQNERESVHRFEQAGIVLRQRAEAAESLLASERKETERLREALITTGRNLGVLLDESVFNEFLLLVSDEARLLRKKADGLQAALQSRQGEE